MINYIMVNNLIIKKKFFNENTHKILDVGCGTGKHALELFKLGYSVDCLDI